MTQNHPVQPERMGDCWTVILPWPDKRCGIPDCQHKHYAKGYCAGHYDRTLKHGDPLHGGPLGWRPSLCEIDGCEGIVQGRGLCNAHYKRLRRHGDPLGGRTPIGAPMGFIDTAVSYAGEDCLVWPFNRDDKGYGSVFYSGTMIGAHRLVCQIVHGPAPSEKHEVAHNCGNGHLGCVNPKHLRWATRKENHADKIQHGTTNRGEAHQLAKLSREAVKKIREMRGKKSGRDLARMFGVSAATICNIQKGDTWTWLK